MIVTWAKLCRPHKIRSKEVAMFNGVRRVDGAKYVVREERSPASVPPAD
jgi:hypothetical protein